MLRILLVRSGSTEYDQQRRVQGALDIPLSEEGARQVEQRVQQLRGQEVEAIYCSPAQSAHQTAQAIGESLGLKPKALERLKNIDLGLWEGMLIDDVRLKQPKVYRQWQDQPEKVCPPQGETIGAARQRVEAVLARLAKKHKDAIVALVVPEPLAAVVRNVLRHDELANLWRSDVPESLWEFIDMPPPAVVS